MYTYVHVHDTAEQNKTYRKVLKTFASDKMHTFDVQNNCRIAVTRYGQVTGSWLHKGRGLSEDTVCMNVGVRGEGTWAKGSQKLALLP